jgi:xylulokinase
VDEQGQALRPAIVWPDQRSHEQVQRVYRELGQERLGRWTGNPLATGFMLASWLWLRQHEPHTCQATAHLLLPKDYVRYRLTGELGAEASDASSTLLFDTARRRWSVDLLDALEIKFALMPQLGESSEVAGALQDEAAAATGLRQHTPVVYGAADQAAQALGNGVVEPGTVSCTIGTGGQLLAPLLEPTCDPGLRLHLFCHALPGRWYLMAATLAAGLALKWLRDNVLENKSYQDLADSAAEVAPGAEGLLFLPHLAGERAPYMDPESKAAFVGLTLRHHRGHLARAVMEGALLALRQGLELMSDLGVPVERVVASGGATQHPLWLQLQADVLNRPIYQTYTVEAAAVGAALLAGVGVGVYPDALAACRRAVRWREDVVRPTPENGACYEQVYHSFYQLYPALKGIGDKGRKTKDEKG